MSMSDQPYAVFPTDDSVYEEAASRKNTLLLGIFGCENAPLSGDKTCCFLTLSYFCFNCDFQHVMIVCDGK